LSYTTFSFSDLSIEEKGGKLAVSVKVNNTGKVTGAEVAQVYVAPKQKAKVNRPVKEMKGFAKVELAAGESKAITVEIESKYAASYWDEERDQWCVEAEEYEIIVSDSSEVGDKAVRGEFAVGETYWWSGL
jgi:beta-glucosidase